MDMSDSSIVKEEVEVLYVVEEEVSSGEEPPMSEWSSIEQIAETENIKKKLHDEGLYSPGSSSICHKYIRQSDSSVLRHVYYNYPPVTDPGILKALLAPEQPVIYPDDGQKLYLHLCSQMNISPVKIFHRNLLNSEINVSYYGVNSKGVRAMAMALQYNKNVQCFNLTENFLDDDGCYHLGHMLKTNSTLKELNLTACRICESGVRRIGDNLNSNRTLVTLNLARNKISDAGGVYFADIISRGVFVKKVILSNNSLGKDAALAFAEAFEWKNPLTHLDLSWNNFFHVPSTVKMLDSLTFSKILQEINLSFNSLEGERIGNVIKRLFTIPSLTVLDLSHNRLQSEAISTLSEGLIKGKKLIQLNLSFNPLSPGDAYNVLEKMLRPRVKLQKLLMENINVNKSFIELLERVQMMKSRKNFVVIYGIVLANWTVTGPDPRDLILKRANYLGNVNKKNRVDVGLYFLGLNKTVTTPIGIKQLIDQVALDSVPLTESVIEQLCLVFPGPKTQKMKTIDLNLLCDHIKRLWPEKKLPPTPPPELEPAPLPPPPPAPTKKGKGTKK